MGPSEGGADGRPFLPFEAQREMPGETCRLLWDLSQRSMLPEAAAFAHETNFHFYLQNTTKTQMGRLLSPSSRVRRRQVVLEEREQEGPEQRTRCPQCGAQAVTPRCRGKG